MDIEVRLFATLRQGRFGKKKLDFSEGSKVRDVVEQFRIAPEEISILLVNGQNAQLDHPLQAGDVVSLFPAVGGG
jgi:molybdopterin synthase sulfur carrier subunit